MGKVEGMCDGVGGCNGGGGGVCGEGEGYG